ncbi:MAG: MBL fold metallo-hydrolase [Clostridium sp.]|nr:MBL fold metallo-hydrolase [Clostridium sp.]
MRMVSIASGSNGNCTYVGSDDTHVLVDAGISNRRIELGLKELGLSPADLTAIFVTHEHSDHISGLNILSKKYSVPIYSAPGTVRAMKQMKSLDRVDAELYHEVGADADVRIGDLDILPFSIDHDAAEPMAYRISCGSKSVAVATDMGHYSPYIVDHLRNLDAALIEANHDVRMLEAGPYPYPLKRRILGDFGHLSNENSGRLISEILNDGIKHIFLGHLSKENNYPELAYETVKLEIDESDNSYKSKDFDITVATRDAMSEVVTI